MFLCCVSLCFALKKNFETKIIEKVKIKNKDINSEEINEQYLKTVFGDFLAITLIKKSKNIKIIITKTAKITIKVLECISIVGKINVKK